MARGGDAGAGPGAGDAIRSGFGVLGALPGCSSGSPRHRDLEIFTHFHQASTGGWDNRYPSDGPLSPFSPSYPSPRPYSSYSPTEYVVQAQSPSAGHPNENRPITTDNPNPVGSAPCKRTSSSFPFLPFLKIYWAVYWGRCAREGDRLVP